MNIPEITYQQLGGNRFKAMTGANNLLADSNTLQFSFKGCKKANKCRITYEDHLDLYNIKFYKLNRKMDCPMVKEYTGVYNDQLTELFTSFTGLYTSL